MVKELSSQEAVLTLEFIHNCISELLSKGAKREDLRIMLPYSQRRFLTYYVLGGFKDVVTHKDEDGIDSYLGVEVLFVSPTKDCYVYDITHRVTKSMLPCVRPLVGI